MHGVVLRAVCVVWDGNPRLDELCNFRSTPWRGTRRNPNRAQRYVRLISLFDPPHARERSAVARVINPDFVLCSYNEG